MKKGLLFVAVISAFSFASCKKDLTCTCTTVSTPTGGGTAITNVSTVTFTKATKAAGRANCLNETYTGSNYTSVTTCELK